MQRFLFAFRGIERQVYLPGSDTRENDVDHSYGLAMLAWYLAPQIDTSLDTDKIIRYALVHDLVEAYAGDTFAFDAAGRADKDAREQAALAQIKQEFPDFPEMTEAIDAYETRSDRESTFVYALDKMMPAFMSCLDEGRCWLEEEVTYDEVYAYDSAETAVSPEVQPYFEALHAHLRAHPEYFHAE